MTIDLLTQPGCGPCVAVKAALKKADVAFTERNVREDFGAFETVGDLGYQGTPVVVVYDDNGDIIEHHYGMTGALRGRIKEAFA